MCLSSKNEGSICVSVDHKHEENESWIKLKSQELIAKLKVGPAINRGTRLPDPSQSEAHPRVK